MKLISCLLIYYLATDYIKQYSREKEGQIDSFARKVISSSNSSRGQIWQIVQKMWSYQIYGATKAIQLIENNVTYILSNHSNFLSKKEKRNLGLGQI